MKAKYYSTLDVDWKEYLEIQERRNVPACARTTGVSFEHSKYPRTFCSCGHSSAKIENECPECGGRIHYFQYWQNTSMISYVWKDGENVRFHNVVQSLDFSGYNVALKIVIDELGVYNVATKSWDAYKPVITPWAETLSRETMETICSICPEFEPLTKINGAVSSEQLGHCVAALAVCMKHPELFSEENLKKNPNTCAYLLRLIARDELDKSHYRCLNEMVGGDLESTMRIIGLPEELYPIREMVFSTLSYGQENIFSSEFADFLKTKVGQFVLSRIRHGQMDCAYTATYFQGILNAAEEYGVHEDVLLFFLKENADACGQINQLSNELKERCKWLRSQHQPIVEDTIRTKAFNQQYNLAHFRKTLTNTDVEKLIREDPLKLIDRIR